MADRLDGDHDSDDGGNSAADDDGSSRGSMSDMNYTRCLHMHS